MKQILGYGLISLGVLGTLGIISVLLYLLMILFFFCPISRCWPQMIVIPLLAGLAIGVCVWVAKRGEKMIRIRK
ncbi:MAG: hypothetical protein SFW36_18980 [Leptolyngbyaceae cyanobacterium bins.59]|nr:hypothetical protein [Leptolyngbyaceae cyanobacterium bins.59]